jgi:putative DNA primase/helicase
MSHTKAAKSTLDYALEMAARGCPILPANPDKSARVKWKTQASTDPATIRKWFQEGATHYGVRCDTLTVLDVDIKADAEQGIADYLELGPLPPTFTVATPSGGFHKYFAGKTRKTKLGDGRCIDVQSGDGAYVIGPGSPGYRVQDHVPIVPLPAHLAERIGIGSEKPAEKAAAPLCEPDTPSALGAGWQLVAHTKGASEGERNRSAHALAGKLKRLGVGPETACDMVLRWNEGNSPPLDDAEVRKTVASSYENGDWRIGEDRPEEEFEDVSAAVDAITKPPTGLVSRLASEITPRAVEWLWPGRFPLGKCAILAGEGSKGKTTVLLCMVATVSRGGDWPMSEGRADQGSVLYFSTEDDADDTIVPRLMAAGADLTRVRIVEAVRRTDGKGDRAFNFQDDLLQLETEIRRIANVRLVIFDPISAYFGKSDTYKNAEVRAVLGPLAALAARHRVSVIGNSHFTKNGNGSANMRILDSVAITAQARSVYVVTDDPDDPTKRLFLPSKANLGPEMKGLRFGIEVMRPAGIEATRVVWEQGDVKITADEAVAPRKNGKTPTATENATVWLAAFLADGPRAYAEVIDHAVTSGMHTKRTLERAKSELGIVSFQPVIPGPWFWTLRNDPRLEFNKISD